MFKILGCARHEASAGSRARVTARDWRRYAQVVNHKGRVHDQRLTTQGRVSFVSPHNGASSLFPHPSHA